MYDAIVLAGGAARRLGGADKPALEIGGLSLLERVLGAVPHAGTAVVVGPQRRLAAGNAASPTAGTILWRREEPVGSGPVAAIAAGFPETRSARVLVLAADLPWIAGGVPALLTALDDHAAFAFLADDAGRPNYLAGVWRRPVLQTALSALGDPAGTSMRALVAAAGAAPVLIRDEGGWGRDCDTWDDLCDARERAGRARADREGP